MKFFIPVLFTLLSVTNAFAKDACTVKQLEEGVYSYYEEVLGGSSPDATVVFQKIKGSDSVVRVEVLSAVRTSSFKEGRTYFLKLVDDGKDFNCGLELYNENLFQIVALDNTPGDNLNVNDFNSRGHVNGADKLMLQTSGFGGCNTKSLSGGSCGAVRAMFEKR